MNYLCICARMCVCTFTIYSNIMCTTTTTTAAGSCERYYYLDGCTECVHDGEINLFYIFLVVGQTLSSW